ncbi:hypothetical protein [Pseudosulfitobacter koreensis]|uniref:Secreted protein n=1 Tax=Pseudosulfitobacter koreensis TaxID=2968472 RepID=A0ABT1Z384_9RHOB|nr:hypothetical protein [Pseudosulfitobacter koreense]MCR8827607.1 hypothetical protein [Pseudosulfitobacter koreense]
MAPVTAALGGFVFARRLFGLIFYINDLRCFIKADCDPVVVQKGMECAVGRRAKYVEAPGEWMPCRLWISLQACAYHPPNN